MFSPTPVPQVFDVRTPEKKAQVASLIPPPLSPASLPTYLPIPEGERDEISRVIAARAMEITRQEEHHMQQVFEAMMSPEDNVPMPPPLKRQYAVATQEKKAHLASLWGETLGSKSPFWYSAKCGIHIKTTQRLIRKLREGQNIAIPNKKRGRKPKTTNPDANIICRSALQADPRTTLRDLQTGLEEEGISMGKSSIHRMLTDKKSMPEGFPLFSFKKLSKRGVHANDDENKEKRIHFVLKLSQAYQDGRTVIYIDETYWSGDCLRRYGWAEEGRKAIVSVPPRSITFCAISCITYEGVGLTEIFRGTVNAMVFESYLKRLFPTLPPRESCILVMDNASTHHVNTETLVQEAGHAVLYNAPNTPDANPIELMFGAWKSKVESTCLFWTNADTYLAGVLDALTKLDKETVRKSIEKVRRLIWPKILAKEDL
jgi:transposase